MRKLLCPVWVVFGLTIFESISLFFLYSSYIRPILILYKSYIKPSGGTVFIRLGGGEVEAWRYEGEGQTTINATGTQGKTAGKWSIPKKGDEGNVKILDLRDCGGRKEGVPLQRSKLVYCISESGHYLMYR